MKKHLFAFLIVALFGTVCHADDSIWLYKKAFSETYHLDKNCPKIAGKKVLAFSLSDETEVRQAFRTAIQLADNCPVCKTPDLRRTKDSRFEEVLNKALGGTFTADEEDSVSVSTLTDQRRFDDELVVGIPQDSKVSSSIYKQVGWRGKVFEIKRAKDERLVGCPITCELIYSRKSNLLGAEGQLIFRPLFLTTEDGTMVPLKHDDIVVRGRNRANLKFVTFPLIVTWFIPGEGAKIKPEDEFVVSLDI